MLRGCRVLLASPARQVSEPGRGRREEQQRGGFRHRFDLEVTNVGGIDEDRGSRPRKGHAIEASDEEPRWIRCVEGADEAEPHRRIREQRTEWLKRNGEAAAGKRERGGYSVNQVVVTDHGVADEIAGKSSGHDLRETAGADGDAAWRGGANVDVER